MITRKVLFAFILILFICRCMDTLGESQVTLSFHNSDGIPLYDAPSENANIVARCYSSTPVIELTSEDSQWKHIQIGDQNQKVEGYVKTENTLHRDAWEPQPFSRLVLYVNSSDVEKGALVYSSDRMPLYHIPNGSVVLIHLIYPNGDCLVSFSTKELPQSMYGFISTSDLTPLDGSTAFYPHDPNVKMNGSTYSFQNYLPQDMRTVFDSKEWNSSEPIIGAIATNRGQKAFVIMKKEGVSYLCYLLKTDGVWELAGTTSKVLYQDDIELLDMYFTLYCEDIFIQYESGWDKHFEMIRFNSPFISPNFNDWRFQSADYQPHTQNYRIGAWYDENGAFIVQETDLKTQNRDRKEIQPEVPVTLENFDILLFYRYLRSQF